MKKPSHPRPKDSNQKRPREARGPGNEVDILRDGIGFTVVKSGPYSSEYEYRVPPVERETESVKVFLDTVPDKYSPKGRKLRKAFERPRPDLPAYADANRTRRSVSITLPPELLDTVNERCRELEVDRTAFIEAAIRLALKPS